MWVQKHLSSSQKTARMGSYLYNLLRYVNEGTDFVAKIVACDETWCPHFDPAFKRMSMKWWHFSSSRSKKAHSPQKVGKFMLRYFFEEKGPLFVEWLQQSTTVNVKVYCNTLVMLIQIIKKKSGGRLGQQDSEVP